MIGTLFSFLQYIIKTNALKKQNEEFQNNYQKVSSLYNIHNIFFLILFQIVLDNVYNWYS